MTTRIAETFNGTRVTILTPVPYEVVLERLNKDIGGSVPIESLGELASKGQAAWTDYFTKKVGRFGFTQFYDINHTWVSLYGVGNGRKMKRIILGNPLIAITMLEHDLNAGIYVPVELLLKEKEDSGQGTEVVYYLPSSLIAGVNKDEKLQVAANMLDQKFEALISYITQEMNKDGEEQKIP
ncbi:hypothetical protein N7510_006604 [Penicillium lagena]|uniref:uncharacterized protein n=1 Tax=Penicillium lagena TaxID=94218 RepID=UPI002541A3E4|nr:uncharacterized protein N7510_006604 [Penicillium lagena]KAJ5613410.1 hypothetical protein N7510_006604 [Penicillium lagena]